MMTVKRDFLVSEVNTLKQLLLDLPEENIIERLSLESRLASVEMQLSEHTSTEPQKVNLTFRGKPVVGSHGIGADFGSKAAGAFAEAFSAIVAALNYNLQSAGPIPNRDRSQLLITGTAVGSFGFEFELPSSEPDLFPENQGYEALKKIEALFRLSAKGTDDDIAEVVEEIHPRAVKKVHEFLDYLVQQKAWCGLSYADHAFRYSNFDEIKRASDSLKDDNIQESYEDYQGVFQGVLPSSRAFEFLVNNDEDLIKGKIDFAIEEPRVLNEEWLNKPVQLKLRLMQVGQGRPRYTLMSMDDVIEISDVS